MVPCVSLVKNPPANTETWVPSLGQKYALKKEMATHSMYCCLGNPTDREVWRPKVHWVSRVGHDWVTKQQNSNTHNSVHQNFPTDQCMKLQNHAWLKIHQSVRYTSKFSITNYKKFIDNSFRFHTENQLQETTTCRALVQYQRQISTINWIGLVRYPVFF